ncbi:Ribonuclease BN [uncultured archaeon]|nr:Ribonuclease BN [uncultured archaeon]
MEVCALASGSSGNCYFAGKKDKGILIDAGISCKQIEERMNLVCKDPSKINAIFITHEHSDHKKGAYVFARKFNIPIFATKKLVQTSFLCNKEELVQTIGANETNVISGIEVSSFLKSHKAVEPIGFTLKEKNGKEKASIITDLGHICENVAREISETNVLFLESNHDPVMLQNGPYPYFLKKWVGGNDGHLSNNQAATGVTENASKKLKEVVLSHISEHNNTQELAMKTHQDFIKSRKDLKTKISLSTKLKPSKLIKLS